LKPSVTKEEEAPERRESARSGIIFCLSARGEGAEASISVILSCWIFFDRSKTYEFPRDRNTIICRRHKHMNEMLLIFSVGVAAGIVLGILMVHE